MIKIEEILGFTSSKGKDSENFTRRFYVRSDDPVEAKAALEAYAETLLEKVPGDLELGEVTIDEEKNAQNLYYGTISFKSPEAGSKIKLKIDDELSEVYGERMSEGRRGGTH